MDLAQLVNGRTFPADKVGGRVGYRPDDHFFAWMEDLIGRSVGLDRSGEKVLDVPVGDEVEAVEDLFERGGRDSRHFHGYVLALRGMGEDGVVCFALRRSLQPGVLPGRANVWLLSWRSDEYTITLRVEGIVVAQDPATWGANGEV